MRTWVVKDEAGLEEVAKDILQGLGALRVVCLHGQLGAGKTTLVKALCRQLGVPDEVQSPTFSIVNEYRTGLAEPVFHFDCYRLKTEEEAYDLGCEEYLYSGYFCFIEWPEKVSGLLNLEKADIFIEYLEGSRHIRCTS